MAVVASTLPAELSIGIVHLGLGAFHRSHQAVYTEQAIAEAGGQWGICAVAMHNAKLVDRLEEQAYRYCVIEQCPTGPQMYEISAIRDALCLAQCPEAVAARLADPQVQVVTVTVTEKGYCFSGAERQLNRADPGIVHDLANALQPTTLPGILVAGLQQRWKASGTGLTVMSCDNLPSNGRLLQRIVLDYAKSIDPYLRDWIQQHCRFPDSMVDRITPAPTERTRTLARTLLGRPDPAAIETEPFHQWVIEDDFAAGRPAWEAAGALFVANVAPFETMKLRMLNGAHSLIAYLGATTGLHAVRDVMRQPHFRTLVAWHMALAADTLDQVDHQHSAQYLEALLVRFDNPAIEHQCLQIAMDGSQKLPQRIFAPAILRLADKRAVDTFALTTALWFQYLSGHDELGQPIDCNDPLAGELMAAVNSPGSVAQRVSALGRIAGAPRNLFDHSAWLAQVADLVEQLIADGAMTVVERLLATNQQPPAQ